MNINNIRNAGYIWDFDQLGEFLDEEYNFESKDEFDWWEELADSMAYLEENGTDLFVLEVNELQDYIKIAKEHGL